MEIISRKEAKARGLALYFTGNPCKHGHISERRTSGGNCKSCETTDEARQAALKKYYNNHEAAKKRTRDYHAANWEKSRAKVKLWRANNPDKVKESTKAWREANGDRVKQLNKERCKRWQKEKPHAANANNAKRRAAKRGATPTWLTPEDVKNIKAVYEMSTRLTRCLGVDHCVDHIIPLRGKTVCGLHVPWNLAAIPKTLNMAKGNKVLQP